MSVDVEVDVGPGIPSFSIVGLPDTAVQEARERVRSALRSSGFTMPNARIVVNLAPGPLKKRGTGLDLPIALGLLVATRQLPVTMLDGTLSVGELSLDGHIRPVPGMIAYALRAREQGLRLLCAADDSTFVIPGLSVCPFKRLSELKAGIPKAMQEHRPSQDTMSSDLDFDQVKGQDHAIRALLVAAAGEHNVLMIGPPGTGKTMLARRMPTILPELTEEERLQTAVVHSVAGLPDGDILKGRRPFRAPHHSASTAGLIGGGSSVRPGEASLAHNGVLFLDEMSEFGPAALQALRQPLEDGILTIVRADARLVFPARFCLVGAANPCPCGYLGDNARRCTCSSTAIDRYRARIGGPLMDRLDVIVHVGRPDPERLTSAVGGTPSSVLRELVLAARERAGSRGVLGRRLAGAELMADCGMHERTIALLRQTSRQRLLSGRAITRILRVARTIADLDGSDNVEDTHLAEAFGMRWEATE